MRKTIIILAIALWLSPAVGQAGAPQKGSPAPDFTVTSLDGKKLTLSSLKGKVVLLGMFHICVPCMNQALEFDKVRKAIGEDKLAIVGVNTNGDSKKAVQDYLDKFPSPIHFAYYVDLDMSVNNSYLQRDMPTVIIIDKEGVINARVPSVSSDQLIPYLSKLL